MKIPALLLAPLLLLVSLPSVAIDLINDEVRSRENPRLLYSEVNTNLHHLTGKESKAELSTLAMELGLSQAEMFHKLQLTLRLNMEPGVDVSDRHPDNDALLNLLDTYANSRYQQAVTLMLKGRLQGRNKIQYQKAIAFYTQAQDLARHEPGVQGLVLKYIIYDHLGSLNQLIRQYATALSHLKELQEVSIKLNNNYLRAHAEASLGGYYNKRSDQARALEHFTQALQLANREPQPQLLAMMNFALAKVHRDMRHWKDALSHAHEAAKGFEFTGNYPYLSNTMTVIAMTYGEQENWHKAIDYYLNAHQIDVREGNRISQALNMHNLGEAYSKLADYANALTYLDSANQFFREKQLNHYLVYNEALLAQVNLDAGHVERALYHASESRSYAHAKKLLPEQIDAMMLQAAAYSAIGDKDKAFETQKAVIELKVLPGNKPQPAATEDGALSQQQLKLALSNRDIKIDQLTEKQRLQSRIVIGGAVVLIMLLISLLYLHQSRRQLKQETAKLMNELKQDCNTDHPGSRALMEALALRDTHATLVLLELAEQVYPELAKGQHLACAEYRHQLSAIEEISGIRSFALTPGLMAVLVEGHSSDKALVAQLSERLQLPSLSAGIIPLPLLQTEEIVVEPEIQFETAQMALSAARSLPFDGSPRFVGLYPLDFAPSVIFAHPLYLKLDKSIQRGLIRVSCSGDKTAIQWPEFCQSASHED
ncbi:tetratricopeptide repeat protein [Shewanella submarina]|uniref:Tetratricopeptide repeat protein n=1 Tax=Shewanella submarina TaxID=2016376 RepID=A0ABV7GG38_9GAMM|nr:tetratricopeptide repeat protein [Shewanella submarina]MCL1037892.1 tetratricopeptide repeat protein [Shewanella submarina]